MARYAIGYKRVSTSGQSANGVSMDAQEDSIRRFCELNGYELVDVCEDGGITGTRLDIRPGLRRAIDLTCQHKGVLVFYSLSRLARSTKDCLKIVGELQKCGAAFAAVDMPGLNTDSATGQLILSIFAAFSQFERDATAERTKVALEYKRQRGEVYGQIPYGYKRGAIRQSGSRTVAELVEAPKEQAVIQLIQRHRKNGEPFRAIAETLNALGLRTRRGTPWSRSRVHQVFHAPGLFPNKAE